MRVLVTGASRGIGAGIARKLAEDARQCGRPLHLAVAASRPGEGHGGAAARPAQAAAAGLGVRNLKGSYRSGNSVLMADCQK